jgi:DMSO/TMAO reductase YedYZ molybdopterin-dependent catalytic subunit
MTNQNTRRKLLKDSLVASGLAAFGVPNWAVPALGADETLVPFTDLPKKIEWVRGPDRRTLDIRTIEGPFTPKDQFFTTQHYGHPEVDPAAFRLKISGLVEREKSFSLEELKKMPSTDVVFGFECSGNRRPLQGLVSNARWTGVPLKTVLSQAGVKAQAKEFVFFGADHGEEEEEFRGGMNKIDQPFGRSVPREKAMAPEMLLAYSLNGEPLTRAQGFPLRLLVPGWYGVAQVKWVSRIHLQEDPYMGKYQARWYRTLKGEMISGEMTWTETAVTRMHLKSFIARVSREGNRHKVLGVVLNDGTPIKSVEVRVDDGPWARATLDPATSGKYSWKLFTYNWEGATPGEHTLVSRVTDVTGAVQPTEQELTTKKTFLEDNSQHPRKVMIS